MNTQTPFTQSPMFRLALVIVRNVCDLKLKDLDAAEDEQRRAKKVHDEEMRRTARAAALQVLSGAMTTDEAFDFGAFSEDEGWAQMVVFEMRAVNAERAVKERVAAAADPLQTLNDLVEVNADEALMAAQAIAKSLVDSGTNVGLIHQWIGELQEKGRLTEGAAVFLREGVEMRLEEYGKTFVSEEVLPAKPEAGASLWDETMADPAVAAAYAAEVASEAPAEEPELPPSSDDACATYAAEILRGALHTQPDQGEEEDHEEE